MRNRTASIIVVSLFIILTLSSAPAKAQLTPYNINGSLTANYEIWYDITVTQGDKALITVSSTTPGFGCYLFDSNLVALGTNDASSFYHTWQFTATQSGTYRLEITAPSSGSSFQYSILFLQRRLMPHRLLQQVPRWQPQQPHPYLLIHPL